MSRTKVTPDVAEIASQAEAEAGTLATKLMTPQRVAQAIAALGGGGGAPTFDTAGTQIGTYAPSGAGTTNFDLAHALLTGKTAAWVEVRSRISTLTSGAVGTVGGIVVITTDAAHGVYYAGAAHDRRVVTSAGVVVPHALAGYLISIPMLMPVIAGHIYGEIETLDSYSTGNVNFNLLATM